MVERGAGEASSPDRAQLLFQEALIHLQKFVEGIAIPVFKLVCRGVHCIVLSENSRARHGRLEVV
jgi:hypothetical protein